MWLNFTSARSSSAALAMISHPTRSCSTSSPGAISRMISLTAAITTRPQHSGGWGRHRSQAGLAEVYFGKVARRCASASAAEWVASRENCTEVPQRSGDPHRTWSVGELSRTAHRRVQGLQTLSLGSKSQIIVTEEQGSRCAPAYMMFTSWPHPMGGAVARQ